MPRLFTVAVLVLTLFAAQSVNAQFSQNSWTLSVSTDRLTFADLHTQSAYGADLQYFVGDRWSLNYSLSVGQGYAHMPASVPLSIFLLPIACYGGEEVLTLLLLPEGVGYHHPVTQNFVVSPYLNALGFDYRNYEENAYWVPTSSAGVRFEALIENYVMVSPYIEYRTYYGQLNDGIRTGLSLGFHIPGN